MSVLTTCVWSDTYKPRESGSFQTLSEGRTAEASLANGIFTLASTAIHLPMTQNIQNLFKFLSWDANPIVLTLYWTTLLRGPIHSSRNSPNATPSHLSETCFFGSVLIQELLSASIHPRNLESSLTASLPYSSWLSKERLNPPLKELLNLLLFSSNSVTLDWTILSLTWMTTVATYGSSCFWSCPPSYASCSKSPHRSFWNTYTQSDAHSRT